MTKEQIRHQAKSLTKEEREQLAEDLLLDLELDLDDTARAARDVAWLAEIRRREAAYVASGATSTSADEVISRLMAGARP